MTPFASQIDYTFRPRDISKIDNTLRNGRDAIVIAAPLSGLSAYLMQLRKHIQQAEHYSQAISLLIDFDKHKTILRRDNNLPINFINIVFDSLGDFESSFKSKGSRLAELFDVFLENHTGLRLIIVIDNLQTLSDQQIKDFLEEIRVISEERKNQENLKRVQFVLGAQSINLSKLDPKHSSPFNIAEKVWLDDFLPTESKEMISYLLSISRLPISYLIYEYVDFLTGGHPYLINHLCTQLINVQNALGTSPKKITFKLIDHIISTICNDGQDKLFRKLSSDITNLQTDSVEVLKEILSGLRFDGMKTSPQIDELKLCGIITNSRRDIWHVRNYFFEVYLRKNFQAFTNLNNVISRRLFINDIGYKMLFDLENDLRDFIMAKMTSLYSSDWEARIDINISSRWGNLRTAEINSGWVSGEEFPKIAYSLFTDLRKVIDSNWSTIFHEYFKPRDVFIGYFGNLEMLRNKIAHNRSLSDQDIEKLETIADSFRECMYE